LHATVLRTFDRRVPRSVAAVGCKVFYYHPRGDRSGALWSELEALPDLHVVHLRRRNVLRTVVSREIADRRDEWLQVRPKDPAPAGLKHVSMTVDQLRDAVERIQRLERDAVQRLSGTALLDVCYEDLVTSPSAEFRRITDFLRVPAREPKGRTLRQNPEPLSVLLENYDELKGAFAGSPLSPWFDG